MITEERRSRLWWGAVWAAWPLLALLGLVAVAVITN